MKCRYCSSTESKVVDSRPTEDGTSIRRRRECINCGKRFTTYEKIEEIPIMVIKRTAHENRSIARRYFPASGRPVKSAPFPPRIWSFWWTT